jgi:hypothetical protein
VTLLVLVGALGLLLLPGFARPLGRWLPPAEWAKLCAGLLTAGALALEAGLVVVGGPTVLRLGVDDLLCQLLYLGRGALPQLSLRQLHRDAVMVLLQQPGEGEIEPRIGAAMRSTILSSGSIPGGLVSS